MTVAELFEYVDEILENPYPDEIKLIWLNQIEAELQVDVLLLAVDGIVQYTEENYGAELIAPAPFAQLYEEYLFWRICLAQQEMELANNYAATFNRQYNEYVRFVAQTINPGGGMAETLQYYLTAYQIAVKHGYTGTETEWVLSLQGETGAPGAGLHIVGQADAESQLPKGTEIEKGTGYLVGDDALLYIWNGAEWFYKKPLRGEKGDPGHTPVYGVDYWTPEEQAAISAAANRAENAAGNANAAADAANGAAGHADAAAQASTNAAENANQKASEAENAAGNAGAAAQAANDAAGTANAAANAANTAAGNADQAAQSAGNAASAANTAAGAASAAAQSASNAETELRSAAENGEFDGKTGPAGVHYGPEQPTDPSHPLWIDTRGKEENPYLLKNQGAENVGMIFEVGEDGVVRLTNRPAAENGGYYTANVTQVDAQTMRISYAASKEGMATIPDVDLTLPAGPAGSDANVTAENIQAALGYKPADEEKVSELSTQIDDVKKDIKNLDVDTTPKIEGTVIADKCKRFAFLMCDKDNAEGFIFFTDPHLAGLDPHEDEMHKYLKTLKTYYDATPTSFIVCGGDWLEDGQTREEACYKLGYTSAYMDANFKNYYPVVGNHDDNSYGVDDEGVKYKGAFSMDTVRNLMMPREEKLYYAFDGAKTRGYVLNSSGEEENDLTMNAYRWEQIAWLAARLKEDDAANSAIFIHAGYTRLGPEAHERTLSSIASNLTLLCQAYNNGATVTLNGTTYDFTGMTGCVRFLLCGHMHNANGVEMHNGIPIVSTYDLRYNGVENFDLCLADYDGETLHMVRVGTGSDRTVLMGSRNFTGNVFTVTVNSENASASNADTLVRENSEYTNKFTTRSEYSLETVTVTMGGVDITDTAYSDGVVTITAVTGDVVITVVVSKLFTNLADPTSADWAEHAVWSDVSHIVGDAGAWGSDIGEPIVTNFIPVEKYDVLRFKGFDRESLLAGQPPYIIGFDENKERVAALDLRTSATATSSGLPTSVVMDENGVVAYTIFEYSGTNGQFTYNNICDRVKYIRISALRTVPKEDVIITVNEEIYPSDDGGSEPVYTNLVPTALDVDGVSVYNSPYGYQNGRVLSGRGDTSTATSGDCVTTGFIKGPTARTAIYVKGSNWVSGDGYCRFWTFSAIGNNAAITFDGNNYAAEQLGEKYWKFTFDNDLSNYWYRITLRGNVDASAGEELIITHGEPIE